MKKIFSILSAMLIVTVIKAQKVSVQKETVKPVVNTDTTLKLKATKAGSAKPVNAVMKKDTFKKAAIKKAATAQEFKYAPTQQ